MKNQIGDVFQNVIEIQNEFQSQNWYHGKHKNMTRPENESFAIVSKGYVPTITSHYSIK